MQLFLEARAQDLWVSSLPAFMPGGRLHARQALPFQLRCFITPLFSAYQWTRGTSQIRISCVAHGRSRSDPTGSPCLGQHHLYAHCIGCMALSLGVGFLYSSSGFLIVQSQVMKNEGPWSSALLPQLSVPTAQVYPNSNFLLLILGQHFSTSFCFITANP